MAARRATHSAAAAGLLLAAIGAAASDSTAGRAVAILDELRDHVDEEIQEAIDEALLIAGPEWDDEQAP